MANRLVDALSGLRGSLPYLYKAAELIRLEKEMTPQLLPLGGLAPEPLPFERDIRLEHMTFRYPKAAVAAVSDVSRGWSCPT